MNRKVMIDELRAMKDAAAFHSNKKQAVAYSRVIFYSCAQCTALTVVVSLLSQLSVTAFSLVF